MLASDSVPPGTDGPPSERPLRALISAFACEPGRGSEPGVGWEVVRALAPHHRLTVVTRTRYRAPIEAQVAAEGGPLADVAFVYLDTALPEAWLDRRGWGENVVYLAWQRALHAWARSAHAREPFDVAHHLTFVRYWMAPGVAGVPGLPTVIGPVGGADSCPPELRPSLSDRGRRSERARDAVRRLFEAAPGLRRALSGSAVAFATTPATEAALRRLGARDVRPSMEVHVWPEAITAPRAAPPNEAPLVMGVGRLIEWKAYHLALEAWARSGLPGRFELFGTGPSLPRLQELAARLGVADRVTFHGHAPRATVLAALESARLMVHPSTHDSGGWAVLEALQHGLPVVCWDHAGPGRQVDASCGAAVPIDPAGLDASLDAMAAALARLGRDDDAWRAASAGAVARVGERFTWPDHAARLGAAYAAASERPARTR